MIRFGVIKVTTFSLVAHNRFSTQMLFACMVMKYMVDQETTKFRQVLEGKRIKLAIMLPNITISTEMVETTSSGARMKP